MDVCLISFSFCLLELTSRYCSKQEGFDSLISSISLEFSQRHDLAVLSDPDVQEIPEHIPTFQFIDQRKVGTSCKPKKEKIKLTAILKSLGFITN